MLWSFSSSRMRMIATAAVTGMLVGAGWYIGGAGQGQRAEPAAPASPVPLPDTLTNLAGIRLVLIPAGAFDMGSRSGSDEQPVHRVTITRPFYMSRYEITQAQWSAVMGTTIAQQRDKADPSWEMRGVGPDYPMYYVTWRDAEAFIERLNQREGKSMYRLPTEAEWEYACRAGSTVDVVPDLDAKAWYGRNAGERAHPTGEKAPNGWGLYDMHGNVWEWCQDWYGPYSAEPQTDPQQTAPGEGRNVRGGCWHIDADGCRAADRVAGVPESCNSSLGFRIVRMVE